MKRLNYIFTCIALVLPVAAGFGQNRLTVELDNFYRISVSGGLKVELVPSESHQMSITAINAHPEDVNIEVDNGELKLRVRPDFDNDDEVKVKVPYSELSGIEATSGALINSRSDFKGKDLQLRAGTGGKIELSVEVKSIDATVNQVADIVLYGKTKTQTVKAGTGGNYLAYELESDETFVRASGGAQAKVTASKIIDATANSKGFVGYIGSPSTVYTKTSLGGEIARFENREDAASSFLP